MKKLGNIIIFSLIIILSIGTIIYKNSKKLEDNIYVVSESEENNKQTISKNNKKNNDKIEDIKVAKSNKDVNNKVATIYISGEVNSPGVVTIDSDKRLSDAIDKLGGLTKEADFNRINLAMKIEDEKHYIIPKIGEELEFNNEESNTMKSFENKDSNKININTATVQELDSLPGVGEATANKILNYRQENGTFKSIEEIKNVNGIGEKKYEDLKDAICIN
ncbi:helix-hairpin-helix domain-containing protein [Clostridium sp. CCUG 7971]|uniref:helix-hairpin-helix domain-containing protein n=1 Tax=Clostridium sp. CCUG 7971 TaxID=2811414 RepID=UPI001ABA0730|nr:helix-hairpin-helix domain-containing protein [Clostridium sp. CCUG 7971]MBO3443245.1 helix-hairpin-helix domain-containing protein [Clostridium sp. CCUG 7971]